jgi:hypothetical protein
MIRRSLRYDWTEDDRLTRVKWMRGMAIFYGCIGLLVLGVITLTRPSSVAPSQARERQTLTAASPGERMIAMPTCPAAHNESCTSR